MISEKKLLSLDPETVSASGAWLFWAAEPEEPFVRCLADQGQLEPILVCRSSEGWDLITGYKRLQACRRLDRKVWAREIEAEAVGRGKIYFAANWPQSLDPREGLIPLRYFQSVCDRGKLLDILTELFGAVLPGKALEDLLAWLNLPEFLDRHLRTGRLPMQAGRILTGFERRDLVDLEPFFAELSWSRNKARQFLAWLLETSRREDKGAGELIRLAGLRDILLSELSPKDRLQALLNRVKKLRYPVLAKLEEEFDQLQIRIGKTSVWSIEAEAGFETDTISLTTSIRGQDDAHRAAQDLERLLQQGYFETIQTWQSAKLDKDPAAPGSSGRG